MFNVILFFQEKYLHMEKIPNHKHHHDLMVQQPLEKVTLLLTCCKRSTESKVVTIPKSITALQLTAETHINLISSLGERHE